MRVIDKETVRKIADLAKLELDDAEVSHYQKQLGQVLQYFELLNELSGDDVTMESCGLRERQDEIHEADFAAKALGLAEKVTGGAFVVPRVIN